MFQTMDITHVISNHYYTAMMSQCIPVEMTLKVFALEVSRIKFDLLKRG